MSRHLFTSESVSEGHPDKMCDQISDAVLDAAIAQDPRSRVACETLCKTGFVIIAGEITTQARLDFGPIAREVIRDIGYTSSEMGFDATTCGVQVAIEPQSPDISQGVTEGAGLFKEQGAGDQGMMFGYACDETPELMPAPIMYSHALLREMARLRKAGKLPWARPDSKSQVTIEYEDGVPKRIDAVVVSTQHSPEVTHQEITEEVVETIIKRVLKKSLLVDTKFLVNPTGRFVIGGPFGDSGLTGRKIIVDTYGGMGHHGGGAFSGKDPSKVDRSAAYYARYIAKNIVAAKLARRCEVQLAYAIGVAQPVSVLVNTFGTGAVDEERLTRYVMGAFDMRPKAVIEQLDLLRPIYRNTAAYGHFGRKEFTWERTDRAKQMAADLLGKRLRGAKTTPPAAPAGRAPRGRLAPAPAPGAVPATPARRAAAAKPAPAAPARPVAAKKRAPARKVAAPAPKPAPAGKKPAARPLASPPRRAPRRQRRR